MPDYGEIFCEAVEEVVRTQLRGLKYDLTQVCQVDDVSERNKGIYWVSTDAARFKAYSMTQNYEVGDTVYVTTPNNDATQQKIIIGKKVIGTQQDITYVMPFNNIKNVTGNIVEGSREVGRLANGSFTGYDTLIWETDRFETGFTRLGLQGSFRSQMIDAVEGSYGLKLELCTRGTTDEIKTVATFYLDADDMYGNPYNFDGYYPQQKVFDISALAGFDIMRLYFYQGQDFKDRDGNVITATDAFGNGLKENLFVNDLYICLGYDIKDIYSDGLILYSNDGPLYDMIPRVKTISWRFIQSLKDQKIKLTTEASKLPSDYKIWLFKENLNAPFSDLAGAGWEVVRYGNNPLTNFQDYQFTTDSDLQQVRYKALIVYNSRVIYESNILEFINTVDAVAAKVDKMMNSFYIYFYDKSNGIYDLYDNKLAASNDANRIRYLFPAFKNVDNEIEYITGVDRVKWIVPKDNTMISLIVPERLDEMISIEYSFPNKDYTTLEEYLEERYFKEYGDKAPNYYIYNGSYYVYFFHPKSETGRDQCIKYTIKQNLNTRYTNNTIYCEIQHNNQILKREAHLTFDEKQVNDYNVEISFVGEEDRFTVDDWDLKNNVAIKKAIIAKLFGPDGEEVSADKLTFSWSWYKPNENGTYNILFSKPEPNNTRETLIGFNKRYQDVIEHYSILKIVITYEGNEYEGYLPIPFMRNNNISVENIVEQFQVNQKYRDTVKCFEEFIGEDELKKLIEYYGKIISSYGDDKYQPQLNNGQIKDIATNVVNLDALYCYNFSSVENILQCAIPAFRLPERNGEIPVSLPVQPPEDAAATFARGRAAEDFIINKSDLSSGRLTEDQTYNGIIIGNVTRTKNTGRNNLYGLYGVQGEKLTFAIDEEGDAYFGGELRGASGTFEGTLNAQEGQIGKWYIKEGALTDSTGQIQLLPITGDDDKPAISIGGLVINAGTILGENAVIDGVDIADSLVQLTAVDGNLQQYITKVDADLEKVENEILKDGNQSVDPNWTSITFIDSIGLSNNGKTINYTTKTVKVLTYGDVTSGQGSFNIKE